MLQHKANKEEKKQSISEQEQRYSTSIQETVLFPHDNIYSHSYQEALNKYVLFTENFYVVFHQRPLSTIFLILQANISRFRLPIPTSIPNRQ